MPKLNFYDTDAVKTFLLNILIENKEAREDADLNVARPRTGSGSIRNRRRAPKPPKQISRPRLRSWPPSMERVRKASKSAGRTLTAWS